MTGSLRAIVAKLLIFTVFTLGVTGVLGAVIGNVNPFKSYYSADIEFTDTTGLLLNDVVKIAGVTVGKVTGAEISDEPGKEGVAVVHIQVEKSVDIPTDATAEIRFRNLIGQRMVVISPSDSGVNGATFPQDGSAKITVDRTSPAFDLGVVFNNLQPVLTTLDANNLNVVSRAIIEMFSGREDSIQTAVAQLADVAEDLGNRGPVIQELVTNLSVTVESLASKDSELRSIITNFDSLLTTLAGRDVTIANAISDVGEMSTLTADLLESNRPGLDQAIAQLRQILDVADAHRDDVDAALTGLPKAAESLNRATTYGGWANLVGVCVSPGDQYICGTGFPGLSVRTSSDLSDIFGSVLRHGAQMVGDDG